MTYNDNNVGFLTGAMRLFSLAATCLLVHGAWAAQFNPETGGNLDDASNWNNTTDTSYAVIKQQSAALTLSADSATLPNSGSLIYRTNVHTNDFGAGNTLTVPTLTVQNSATLVHKSGGIIANNASAASQIDTGSATITGENSTWSLQSLTVNSLLKIEDRATVTAAGNVNVNSGATLSINGGSVTINPTANHSMAIADGGVFAMTDGTLTLSNNKTTFSVVSGANVAINGSTITVGDDGAKIGGDGGTLLFTGNESSISSRFTMIGDEFVFCVSNTTVNFASDSSSKLFITGGETSPTTGTSDRTLKFCGYNPHLRIYGKGGLFLRGSKTTLLFDLPKGEYTTEPVVELMDSTKTAEFKGDTGTKAASQIVVNIDNHTAPGTYTLLKGKNASTFLTGENKWVTNSDRAVISAATVDGVDYVQVTVKPLGLTIIFK